MLSIKTLLLSGISATLHLMPGFHLCTRTVPMNNQMVHALIGKARLLFLPLVFCATGLTAEAQFSIADGDVTLCSGLFVDDGFAGPYTDNNYVITICPDIPGDAVSILFTSFQLQTNANPNNNDVLLLYDGNSTGAPLVGAPSGNAMQGISITASENNPSGCLTFQLIVNHGASGGAAGWEAR